MLFQIRDTQVTFVGSIHRQPNGNLLPQCYADAISASESCYFECNPINPPRLVRGVYVPPQNLLSDISSELYQSLVALFDRLRAPRFSVAVKPWRIGMALSHYLNEAAGHSGQNSVERQLWQKAEQLNKARFLLDEDVFDIFDSTPIAEQTAGLTYVASDPERAVSQSKRLYHAWLTGDAKTMAEIVSDGERITPVLIKNMFHKRNLLWLPTILQAVQENKRAVFVVGAGHVFYGDYSLKRLLESSPHNLAVVQSYP